MKGKNSGIQISISYAFEEFVVIKRHSKINTLYSYNIRILPKKKNIANSQSKYNIYVKNLLQLFTISEDARDFYENIFKNK